MKLVLLIAVMACAGCGNSGQPKKGVEPKSQAAQQMHQISCGCYYLVDNKYFSTYAELEIASWKAAKIEAAQRAQTLSPGIFGEQGGGPSGAAWNSDADWFCMAKLPAHTTLALKLNGNLRQPEMRSHTLSDSTMQLVTFELPATSWIPLLDSADFVQGSGHVLQVEFQQAQLTETICSHAFTVAYGE